jgi:hypothetical protein
MTTLSDLPVLGCEHPTLMMEVPVFNYPSFKPRGIPKWAIMLMVGMTTITILLNVLAALPHHPAYRSDNSIYAQTVQDAFY